MIFLRKRTWNVEARGRRWIVRRDDSHVAGSVHDDKSDAVARAVDLSRRAHGRCRVKSKEGRVEAEIVFMDDASAPDPSASDAPATTRAAAS